MIKLHCLFPQNASLSSCLFLNTNHLSYISLTMLGQTVPSKFTSVEISYQTTCLIIQLASYIVSIDNQIYFPSLIKLYSVTRDLCHIVPNQCLFFLQLYITAKMGRSLKTILMSTWLLWNKDDQEYFEKNLPDWLLRQRYRYDWMLCCFIWFALQYIFL